jgi:hypothetical protein
MSKKLIAVAAAAALALAGLVGVAPASANSAPVVTIIGSLSDSDVSAAAQFSATAAVNGANTANVLTHGAAPTTDTNRTTVKFTISISEATSRSVTVTSAGGVKMLSTLSGTDKDSAGITTLTQSDSTATPDIVFYAWTKSTTAGTVTVVGNGVTTVYYVKGTAGPAYNIVSPVFPTNVTSAATTTSAERVSFQITDVFGNTLTSVANGTGAGEVKINALGADDDATGMAVSYNTTRKQFEGYVNAATATTVAMNIALNATDLSDNGWPAPVKSAFATSSSVSLATQVTNLTAQVATLNTTVAALTADYNKLATRWNTRYDLKKAPKKKVALK